MRIFRKLYQFFPNRASNELLLLHSSYLLNVPFLSNFTTVRTENTHKLVGPHSNYKTLIAMKNKGMEFYKKLLLMNFC